jgi:hypothetical protein
MQHHAEEEQGSRISGEQHGNPDRRSNQVPPHDLRRTLGKIEAGWGWPGPGSVLGNRNGGIDREIGGSRG